MASYKLNEASVTHVCEVEKLVHWLTGYVQGLSCNLVWKVADETVSFCPYCGRKLPMWFTWSV